MLRNVEIIGNNNAIINRYACRIAELENVSLQERQAKKEEIGILNRKILCLIAENKRVCENSSVDALFVLEELKQGNLIISNMIGCSVRCPEKQMLKSPVKLLI